MPSVAYKKRGKIVHKHSSLQALFELAAQSVCLRNRFDHAQIVYNR